MRKIYYLTFLLLGMVLTGVPWQPCYAVEKNAGKTETNRAADSPPVITADLPSSQTNAEGSTLIINVVASGNNLSYQWQISKDGGTTFSDIPGFNINSVTKFGLSAADQGIWRCVVTNSAGIAVSNELNLTVTPATVTPTITTQPTSQALIVGAKLTLTARWASASRVSEVQWYKDGTAIAGANVLSSNSATFTINNVVLGDAGTYYCVVANSYSKAASDKVQSSDAVISVSSSATAPTVSPATDPAARTTAEGGPISLGPVTTVGGISFQWQKSTDGTTNWADIPGATTSTYSKPSAVYGVDDGYYRCIVTGTTPPPAISGRYQLTVSISKPTFTTPPQAQTLAVGDPLKLNAVATGTAAGGTISYQWRKGGVDIASATGQTYSIASVVIADAGSYTCIATNSAGSTASGAVNITVNATATLPVITTQPKNQTRIENQLISLSVTASGNNLSYQWQKDGSNISGATTATYAKTATLADAGNYTCGVSNSAGIVTSATATVTINIAPPVITTNLKDKVIPEGSNAKLEIYASGSNLTYQWKKNGIDIAGASGPNYNIYPILDASTADAGTYTCVVSNGGGSVTTAPGVVTISQALPGITTQPQNQTIVENGTLTLNVVATGLGLSYQWRKDGADISGANAANYTKSNITPTDAGAYLCIVTNTAGSVSSGSATIAVTLTTPVITTQPQSQTVNEKGNLNLSVTSTGSNLTYQWKKDTQDISGATAATFTKNNVEKNDAGNYSCTISNSAGSVTSDVAKITISLGAPVITAHPQNQFVLEHTALTVSITAAGTDLSYQWKKDGQDIAGAVSSTYTNTNAAMTDAGNYTVVVSNATGSVTSNAAAITVATSDVMPVVTVDPLDVSVTENGNITLSISATGTNLKYQWQKDGGDIAGANTSTYTKSKIVTADAGKYLCVVSNGKGLVSSGQAIVTVNLAKPIITSQPTDQTVIEKTPLTLSVAATGTAVKYQWKKNGIDIAGATATTYTNPSPVMNTDNGDYTCLVYNTGGNVLSNIAKVVISTSDIAPKITTQPKDITVTENDSLALTIAATGTPLNYQWKKGDKDIAGATAAIYKIKKAALADSGAYKCVISNLAGTVTSVAVIVAVNKAEVLYIPLFDGLADEYQQKATDKVELKAKGPGSELLINWFIDGTAVTAVENKFYLELSIAAGNHTVKAETADGKFNIEKPVIIKKTN
ncbi:hypothetical protein GS399_15335 [Pedobacter sp. HMF7647]|uniref:Ig-like domain-containing protein n=1 Tax=Hufsiella arboris TaxID=2695275 RepID=A0A7K1YCN7_9SPHI|nr:immunoglobulin domain-containing protein [Hufsiella arboris]MXV52347.1 hypothetical protein [Hufsiella arboris]